MIGFKNTGMGKVLQEWIDMNGHMNIAKYTELFDLGCEKLLSNIGITPDSVAKGGVTVVAALISVQHRQELRYQEPWELWSGLQSASSEQITFTHRICSDKGIRAACYIRSYAFDPLKRARATFPMKHLLKASRLIVKGLAEPFLSNLH